MARKHAVGLANIAAMIVLAWAQTVAATTLDDYIGQVLTNNKTAISAQQKKQSGQLKASEANLLTNPNLFVEGGIVSDGKPPTPTLLTYDRVESENVKLGVSQNFDFGLSGKVYYEQSHSKIVNAPSLPAAALENYDVNPVVELAMPLWGNGFGRSVRAQKSLITSGSRIEELQGQAQLDQLKIVATNTYWALAVSQEVLEAQKSALKNAENILRYVQKKSKMRLGEKSSVLQAQSLVSLKKFELRKAEAETRTALYKFNALRGVELEAAVVKLNPVSDSVLTQLQIEHKRTANRTDVEIAKSAVDAKRAESQLAIEKYKPSLNIIAKYGVNGRGDSYSQAQPGSDYEPTKYIGLQFNMPLDFASTSKVKQGARLQEQSALNSYNQALLDQDRDWIILQKNLKDANDAYQLMNEVVKTQKLKLENEKQQLKLGKSTTFQVLQFEQEYTQAETNRLRIAQQIFQLETQSILYKSDAKVKGE